jgi:GR25 family glycosyltransferase involved in LPS biosynthesis
MRSKFLLALFALFSTTGLFCGIEQFFKIPTDTSGNHQMKNIDFIYTINLDKRPEKFESCTKQLHPLGIFPYRFSAVNGWEISFDTFSKLGVVYSPEMKTNNLWGTCYLPENNGQPFHEILHVPGRTYFSHCMSRGAVGIVLSHMSILQHAYDSGFNTIWVMEDDIDLIQNPHLLSDAIEKLDSLVGKKGWDILFTDQDTKNQKGEYVPCRAYARKPNFSPKHPERFCMTKDISPEFRKIGARYGAYSMIVRRSGMKKILDFIKTYKVFLPYDMEFYLPNDIRLYSVIKDIVSTQINAPSDNGGPGYLKNNPKTTTDTSK